MSKFNQGKFRPVNYLKYKGNPTNIFYRSGWELSIMSWFDRNDSILEWNSEENPIPYKDPVTGRLRRYFPDFWVKKRNSNGSIDECIVEVKPLSQSLPPKKGDKKMQVYLKEVKTYATNQAKWKAAKMYCEHRGYKFLVITKNKNGQFMTLNEGTLGIDRNIP